MDTDRIRYFITVAKAGSLRAASEILHISPPALSKAMTLFQQEIGSELFGRSGRNLVLTEEGKHLLPRAEKAVEEIQKLRVKALKNPQPPLRIGSFEVFSTYFLGELIRDYFPNSFLELHELPPGELEQALYNGKFDVGITYLPIPTPGLDFLPIGTARMAVFGNKSFLTKTDFASFPFAVPIYPLKGTPTRVDGLDGWADEILPRQKKFQVSLMQSALDLCRHGLAVAYLPVFIVALYNEGVIASHRLVELPAHSNTRQKQDVFLIKRKGTEEGETIRKLARAIRKILRREPKALP